MFKSSEKLRQEAAQRQLDRVASSWRAARTSWFDGTPEAIEARLAETNRLLTVARSGVTPAHLGLAIEAENARKELLAAKHRLLVDFLDDGARAFKGSRRVAAVDPSDPESDEYASDTGWKTFDIPGDSFNDKHDWMMKQLGRSPQEAQEARDAHLGSKRVGSDNYINRADLEEYLGRTMPYEDLEQADLPGLADRYLQHSPHVIGDHPDRYDRDEFDGPRYPGPNWKDQWLDANGPSEDEYSQMLQDHFNGRQGSRTAGAELGGGDIWHDQPNEEAWYNGEFDDEGPRHSIDDIYQRGGTDHGFVNVAPLDGIYRNHPGPLDGENGYDPHEDPDFVPADYLGPAPYAGGEPGLHRRDV